jgi:hypothetical protein
MQFNYKFCPCASSLAQGLSYFMYFCPDAKVPALHPKFYPNHRFGNTLCTFHGKSTKTTAHSPTLKVGFAAEAILQVADVFAVTD